VLGAVQQKGCPGKKEEMFTKEYIEMVIKAKEIQDLCKHKNGDWFIDDNSNIHVNDWNQDRYQEGYIKQYFGKFKWLPTLEDLFWIAINIKKYPVGFYEYLNIMDWLRAREKPVMDINCNSIHEIILTYIMEKKYHKSWNKKEWEEVNGS
jgi:hypothetical protein